MLVELVIGDWSNDGHGRSSNALLATEYNSVSELYGSILPLLDEVCVDYEDNLIPYEIADNLKLHGASFEGADYDDDDKLYYMCSDTYTQLVLDLMVFKDPTFTYKIVEPAVSIDIGGYGLF